MTGKIKLTFSGRDCTDKAVSLVTTGSVETVTAAFTFDAEWDSFVRTAIFTADGTVKRVVLDDANACAVPWEVLKNCKQLTIGVVGTSGVRVLPSVPVTIPIIAGVNNGGTPPDDPTPDIYAQLLDLAKETQQIAQSVRDDANAGKFTGAPGADGKTPVKGVDYWTAADVAEIDAAKDAATQAAEDANSAASSAVDAAGSAYFAANSATAAAEIAEEKASALQAKADAGDFDGKDGSPGADGYTPVRGVDYWTEADKAAMNAAYANAAKTTVCGASISVSDVSPLAHPVTVKVRSKNIIPYPYANTTKTDGGITWTDNGDGTVTASGTATKDSFFTFAYTVVPYTSGKYTLSGCPSGGTGKTYYIYTYSPADNTRPATDYGDGVAAAYDSAKTYRVYAMIANGVTVDNLVFRPQLEYGTTATTYTPYVSDLTDIDVDVRRLPTDDEMQTFQPDADGTVAGVTSLSPNMAISTSRMGSVVIEMVYNRDAADAIAALQRASDALSGKVTLLKEITTTEAATVVELLSSTAIRNFFVEVEIAQADANTAGQLILDYTDGSAVYCTISNSLNTTRANKSSFIGFDSHGMQPIFCRNQGTSGIGGSFAASVSFHAGDNTIKRIRYQAIGGAAVPVGSKFAIYGILED